jgi:subtilisin family serine protease
MSRSLMVENFGQRDLDYRLMEFPAQNPALLDLANGRSGVMAPAAMGIDPTLYEQFEASPDGKVDFFIAFKDTADLTQAYYMMDWNERGQFVVNSLKAKAEQAQANVKAWLDTHDITYTSYWINNSLFVHAEKSVMDTLATFPEVSGFKANEVHNVFPIEATMLAPRERVIKPCYSQPSAPDAEVAYQADLYLADYAKRLESSPFAPAYPWNVMFPAADQVHTNFGVKGQGIVVGGMDTGVDYDHVGLVNNYRGYLGGGQFDHTYSWFDPQNNCGGIPCDTDGHGTATHGIMAGDDDPSLPDGAWIGMAPDAQWIHCVGCPGGSCPSSATTACAQWFLAPGGDPDMRPTVVNHSWGSWSPNSCTGSFMAELEAYRAADIFPAFAAGNVGDYVTPPHCFSSTPPANTVDANGNPLAFASGAHGSDGSLDYYSSGGPNACNNDKLFPDLASPGLGSCTTGLNSTYNCSFGGTSSASPHTAGCVALIRAANPTLSVAEVEQALRDTAIDVDDTGCGGTPDWNNKYGEGWLNCYGAVESVISLDIPWLSETPVTGTIAPQDQTDVAVTFDATDMEPGTYTGTLIIDHNDPMTEATELLVQLTVVENAGVVLEPMTTTLTGDPETMVTYTLHITNTGDMTETFNLTKDGDTWMTTMMPDSVELASMESADILVTVMIPNVETLQLSACDTVTITAAGDLSPAMDDAMLTTCGIYDTGVVLEPMTATLTGDPEAVVTYTLNITNTGDATETFDLTKDDDTWMTTVMPDSVELASMESSEILVTVMIPGVETLQISACDVVTVTATGGLTSAMDYSVLTTCGIPEREVYLPLVMREF